MTVRDSYFDKTPNAYVFEMENLFDDGKVFVKKMQK